MHSLCGGQILGVSLLSQVKTEAVELPHKSHYVFEGLAVLFCECRTQQVCGHCRILVKSLIISEAGAN